ncbi:MAG: hypothetical protein K6T83_18120 [Alicyclobacillus sp.]|nr:hypothetical protein [Alicyclobacillus sp.]
MASDFTHGTLSNGGKAGDAANELTQGGIANITGNTLERMVMETLLPKGFRLVPWRDYVRDPDRFGPELLLRQAEYTTIYQHKGKSEFLLRSARYQLDMRIECKWQQSAGSVDEKFPYLYLNCVEAMPERDIMIVVDGGGAKAGAVAWLKHAAAQGLYLGHRDKWIQVVTLSEFIVWAHRTLR